MVAAALAGGFYAYTHQQKQPQVVMDYKNATYTIEGTPVTLVNGESSVEAAPGSASKIVTKYFGNEVQTDLNGDGRVDVAFLLTQSTGGSGTFYYIVGALNTGNGYVGTDAVLLGDRIAPQTTEISQNPAQKGVIVVNYADRAPGEPMTAQPSIGKSIWLKLDSQTKQWGEVAQNFEGEADVSKMALGMKTWNWISAQTSVGSITPKTADKFSLTFNSNGTFSAKTDCNGVGGSYSISGNKLSFSKMVSTLMYCDGSQESVFTGLLQSALGYHFTSKGELVLDLAGNGTATFR